MSDTPRTDEVEAETLMMTPDKRPFNIVMAHARQLERELSDMTADYFRRHKDAVDRWEALQELVRLKDLKDHVTRGFFDPVALAEYERCQPLAWEAARAALRTTEGGCSAGRSDNATAQMKKNEGL